jgi:hypothetical protein
LSYTTEPNWVIRKRISKYRSVTFNDIRTVSQTTWLTPTYPMKRIYFRHWYTWTIGRQSNLWRQYLRFVLQWQNWGYMKPVKWICCCSSLPFEYWYGSNLWFWNHVWLEFKPNFFWTKENFIWNVFSNIALMTHNI